MVPAESEEVMKHSATHVVFVVNKRSCRWLCGTCGATCSRHRDVLAAALCACAHHPYIVLYDSTLTLIQQPQELTA